MKPRIMILFIIIFCHQANYGQLENKYQPLIGYDGRLVAINYRSKFETELKRQLIESDKKTLHASIQDFSEPVLIFETKKFRIRIDDLGDENYRYASWSINKPMSDKPDLVLTKGKWIPLGSGGNHQYEFANGDYRYECYVEVLGEESAILTIYKGNDEILIQDAEKIFK